MTKEDVQELEKIVRANLKAITKIVSKDLGIRFPQLKLSINIDADVNSTTRKPEYWLYLVPKNKAIQRHIKRSKLLNDLFDDATIEALCTRPCSTTIEITFAIKITAGSAHHTYNAGIYEISLEQNDNGFTTTGIRRI